MPRGKKKIDNENVSAQAATKPTAQAAPTKKPRTTKAKAAQTVAKSADKPVKKTTKKSAAPKAAVPTAAKSTATTAKNNVRKSVNKVEATPKAVSKSEKKTTSKKAAAPAPKRTVRKSAKGTGDQVILQGNSEYTFAEITEMCKKAYRNGTKKQIKTIKIYVKAENNTLMAYYVVNETQNGSVKL